VRGKEKHNLHQGRGPIRVVVVVFVWIHSPRGPTSFKEWLTLGQTLRQGRRRPLLTLRTEIHSFRGCCVDVAAAIGVFGVITRCVGAWSGNANVATGRRSAFSKRRRSYMATSSRPHHLRRWCGIIRIQGHRRDHLGPTSIPGICRRTPSLRHPLRIHRGSYPHRI
jgi:hypothetical protein